MLKNKRTLFLLALLWLPIAAWLVYQLPPVRERLEWRIAGWRAQIQYALNPPEAEVFVPKGTAQPMQTIPAITVIPTSTPTFTPLPEKTATPQPTATFTPTATGIPQTVLLGGIVHEYQKWNNCGPAALSMALSFWNWQGDQRNTAAYLKPNQRDKNVMPYEMADYVNSQTDLRAIVRTGGNLTLLKQLIAAGFPVVVEKGFEIHDLGWMGHYQPLNGYDDLKAQFIAQDSYILPDLPEDYAKLEAEWRAFNYLFLVIYPPERETELAQILGSLWDETTANQVAAQTASNEIYSLAGRDQAFAWFNRGSSLVALQDYAGAAEAYDQFFALYPQIPEKQRPWRMMWYQTGPYWAYFYTGRYADVIQLATTTIANASEPMIEESFYWRALAREASGDTGGAISDLQRALEINPNFAIAQFHLNRIQGN